MISIVVPAYNEEEAIEDFINAAEREIKLQEPYELLILNDGSTDKTKQIIERMMKKHSNIRLINHKENKGLGAALKTCFENAKGRIIVTMDSDLTHPPKLVRTLIENCEDVDVCIASRYVKGGGMKDVPFWRVLISKAINKVLGILLIIHIKDLTAGFKAYKSDILKSITINQTGFEVQLEIITNLIRKRCKFKEIPLILVNRKQGISKFKFSKEAPKYFLRVFKIVFINTQNPTKTEKE